MRKLGEKDMEEKDEEEEREELNSIIIENEIDVGNELE